MKGHFAYLNNCTPAKQKSQNCRGRNTIFIQNHLNYKAINLYACEAKTNFLSFGIMNLFLLSTKKEMI